MHPVKGVFTVVDPMGFYGRGYNIGDLGVLLGKLSREIHLFPAEFLSGCDSGEAKFRAHSFSFYEVNHAV